jgi:hypothetical protein
VSHGRAWFTVRLLNSQRREDSDRTRLWREEIPKIVRAAESSREQQRAAGCRWTIQVTWRGVLPKSADARWPMPPMLPMLLYSPVTNLLPRPHLLASFRHCGSALIRMVLLYFFAGVHSLISRPSRPLCFTTPFAAFDQECYTVPFHGSTSARPPAAWLPYLARSYRGRVRLTLKLTAYECKRRVGLGSGLGSESGKSQGQGQGQV